MRSPQFKLFTVSATHGLFEALSGCWQYSSELRHCEACNAPHQMAVTNVCRTENCRADKGQPSSPTGRLLEGLVEAVQSIFFTQ